MSRFRTILVVAAGLVLIASSAAHSLLGWPQLLVNLHSARVPLDLIGGLAMGWHFAGVAMLTLGLLALWLASVAQRSVERARARRPDRHRVCDVRGGVRRCTGVRLHPDRVSRAGRDADRGGADARNDESRRPSLARADATVAEPGDGSAHAAAVHPRPAARAARWRERVRGANGRSACSRRDCATSSCRTTCRRAGSSDCAARRDRIPGCSASP